MRVTVAFVAAALGLVSAASGHVVEKRQEQTAAASTNIDATVLNFALILEHLENTFYSQGLANFSQDAFTAAGYNAAVRTNLQEIAADEASHVKFLTGALQAAGATPVQACTYKFGVTDVKGFLGLAQVLEGVGVSAYLGAAPLITSAAYLEAAGTILTVEARHNAFIRLVNGKSPFPAPYDVGISPRSVVSLAGSFFASCPSGSAPTFAAFPAAAVTNPTAAMPGGTLQITANTTLAAQGAPLYCGFASGGVTAFTSYSNNACQIPSNTTNGQNYVYITNGPAISDNTTIAGPAIIDFGSTNTSIFANTAAGSGSSGGSSGSSPSNNGGVNTQAGAASFLSVSKAAGALTGLVAVGAFLL